MNGNVCPLYSESAQCPTICVSNVDLCPEEFAVKCPTESLYCGDGVCRDTVGRDGILIEIPCKGVQNVCDCNKAGYEARNGPFFMPCNMSATTVSTAATTHTERTNLRNVACASMANIPLNRVLASSGILTNGNSSESLWLECTLRERSSMVLLLPVILFWVVVCGFFVALVAWIRHKSVKEREILVHDQIRTDNVKVDHRGSDVNNSNGSDTRAGSGMYNEHVHSLRFSSFDSTTPGGDDATEVPIDPAKASQYGYVDVLPGKVMRTIVSVISWMWTLVFIILINDYYAQSEGGQIVFQDRLGLSGAFVLVWHMAAFWFVAMYVYRSHIDNFFRIRCGLETAEYVKFRRSFVAGKSSNYFMKQFKKMLEVDELYETCQVGLTETGSRFIVFECLRYVLNPEIDAYEETKYNFPNMTHTKLLELGKVSNGGLNTECVHERRVIVGENMISIPEAGLRHLVRMEFQGGFYIYQGLALSVWYFFNFFLTAFVQTIVILCAGLINATARYNAHKSIRSIAERIETVSVLRDGDWVRVHSTQIVPGDVIELEVDMNACCDGVLVQGAVVVDESSLTGETMPLHKTPLVANQDLYVKRGVSRKSTILAGSRIRGVYPVQVGERVIVLALETGAWTEQGDLIRRILFPNPVDYEFTQQLPLVFCILFVWGIFAFGFAVFLMHQGNVQSWFYGALGITQIISPMLSTVLVVGQTVAAARLQEFGVWCVDFSRIAMGGALKTFCFDKTGTLTTDKLTFDCALAVVDDADHYIHKYSDNNPFSIDEEDDTVMRAHTKFSEPMFDALSMPTELLRILASCHSVMEVGADRSATGNRVDVELLILSKWKLEIENDFCFSRPARPYPCSPNTDAAAHQSPRQQEDELCILKRFEFEHERGTMCVIALDCVTFKLYAFTKGSAQKVIQLCNQTGIPRSCRETVTEAAREGAYVLAVAQKLLCTVMPPTINRFERQTGSMSDVNTAKKFEYIRRAQKLAKGFSYSQCNIGMDMVALLFLRNPVKQDSYQAVSSLHRGGVRCVMLTGDNVHTAVNVAEKVGMIVKKCEQSRNTSRAWQITENNAMSDTSPRLLIGSVSLSDHKRVMWVDSVTQEIVLNIHDLINSDDARKKCIRRFGRHSHKHSSPQQIPLLRVPSTDSTNSSIGSPIQYPSNNDDNERYSSAVVHSAFMPTTYDSPIAGKSTEALNVASELPMIHVSAQPTDYEGPDNVSESSGVAGHKGVELAITGEAFGLLKRHGELAYLLPHTRVFAEMTPQEKRECVEAYMRLGHVTGMCGDGGNDSGALRAANIGMAMGGDVGTVVASFASKDRTIGSVVVLLQEARGALCNAMSLYKFIIGTGQVVTIAGFVSYYFTVASSQYVWLTTLIDGLLFSYTLSLSKPRQDWLHPKPPSAALLDMSVVLSVVALVVTDALILIVAVLLLFNQSWFLCKEFDGYSTDIDTATWWELGDNFESSLISIVTMYQICFAGFTYSMGLQHRQPWYRNIATVIVFVVSFVFFTYLLVADPNYLGCAFRFNCGDYDILMEMGLYAPSNAGPDVEKYHSQNGHNIFPMNFRILLLVLMVFNLALNVTAELTISRIMDHTPVFTHLSADEKHGNPERRTQTVQCLIRMPRQGG
eukprot:CFRG2428T1